MSHFPYRPPHSHSVTLRGVNDASFAPMPADGVLPDGFFSTPGPWEQAHRPIPVARRV